MKMFSSEFAHNYGSYSFGYCNYCEYEPNDSFFDIYQKGFLPYSGSEDVWNMFYMARSARVNVSEWEPTSENRRVLKKYSEAITRKVYSRKEFEISEEFTSFCLSYFSEHHGAHTMPQERLLHILQEKALTHIVEYRDGSELAGYVFLVSDVHMSHVWFYFYAPSFAQTSFGMWVLLNEASVAQHEDKKYFYIGTAYGDKSRYKTNFAHLEFWNGNEWKQDTKNEEVKTRIKNDHVTLVEATDTFKKDKKNFFNTNL